MDPEKGELGLMLLLPLVLVLVVVVGLKVMNNGCSSWNPLVLGCTRLGKENGPFSRLAIKVDEVLSWGDLVILMVVVVGGVCVEVVVVVAVVKVVAWQLRTMAKRSQSS